MGRRVGFRSSGDAPHHPGCSRVHGPWGHTYVTVKTRLRDELGEGASCACRLRLDSGVFLPSIRRAQYVRHLLLVFRKDRTRVQLLRDALADHGFSVFWDQQVPANTDWDPWIRQQLSDAACALVVWSEHSVTSDN